MKSFLVAMLCFLSFQNHAQEHKNLDSLERQQKYADRALAISNRPVYFKLEFTVPFVGNPQWDEVEEDVDEYQPWFLPAGFCVKAGTGFKIRKIISVGIGSGVDTRLDHALVVAPVFGDFTLMPKIDDGLLFYAGFGYGKAFALGRGELSGFYRRIAIGAGDWNGRIFIEASQYGFKIHNLRQVTNISRGIALSF